MRQSTLIWLGISVIALVLAPSGTAYASVSVFNYSSQTSAIQVPSVALQGGTEGSSTISSVAADAATLTVSSTTYPPYVVIALTNSQSSPTSSGFQQQVTFNPSAYSSYESSNLGNIRFCADAACLTTLHAWLESCTPSCSPSATSAVVWINLASSIPAKGVMQIYMVFLSSGGFDGIYWGEAPNLSGTYGQYDNGAYVFLIYNNGGNLLALSQTGTGGIAPASTLSAPGPYTHAITGSVNGGSSSASAWTTNGETTTTLPASYIAQVLVYMSGTAALSDLLTNVQNIGTGQFYVFRLDTRASGGDGIGYYPSGAGSTTLAATGGTSTVNTWYQLTAVNAADQLSLYKSTSFALESQGALEDGPITGQGYTGGGVAITTDGASSTEYWSMLVVRMYPPNGEMPAVSIGSIVTFQVTVPVTITNSQSSATPYPFQEEIVFNPSTYSNYEAWNLGNIRFCSDAACNTMLYAWLESCTPSCSPSATSAIAWVKLTSSISGGGGTLTIYMEFLPANTNFDVNYWGEAPQLSTPYGLYDNGGNIFVYYNVAPASITGWTINSAAGQTSTAPAGSYFQSTDAYYANSANGDYMYTQIPGLATNEVMTFWTYTTGLGNLFFLTNSAGNGQMGRLDSRGGGNWVGLASTTSWTSWAAPSSGLDKAPNTWYKYDIVLSGSTATSYIGLASNNLASLGSTANTLSVSNNGNYIGLVGDGLGSSHVTYWNGLIVRYLPPSGVMPSTSFGSVTPNYGLAIANQVSSSWNVNLAVASSSNTNRLYNLTIWFYSPTSTQIQLGTGVTQTTTGPVATLSGSGTLYIVVYASSTSVGSSIVTLSLKVQQSTSGPYAQYTINVQVN